MIILDTHIWIWWVHDESRLTAEQLHTIRDHESQGLGISAISCWEVAKLVEKKRLLLPTDLEQWFDLALSYPGVQVISITPDVAIRSTRFPAEFSQDPADQLISATALVYNCPLVTSDTKLREYDELLTIY